MLEGSEGNETGGESQQRVCEASYSCGSWNLILLWKPKDFQEHALLIYAT